MKTTRCFFLFLLLVFVFVRLLAQDAKPDTYAGFEGKVVSRVAVSIGPETNGDAFASLIKQKAGHSYSAVDVRQSVDALQQTKQFTKVDVRVEPGPAGLNVLFVLEPASYVGILQFPGATSKFGYTRLLQATNIPEQSPYFSELLPQGQKGLVEFLQEQGYFTATVEPGIQRDDPHQIVNIVYRVKLGPAAKVGRINIEGVSAAQAESIRRHLDSIWAKVRRNSLKSGQRYSQAQIGKAVDRIRSYLRSESHIVPVVRHTSSEYNPQTNQADVTFQVDPGPEVSIAVTGAHIWKRTLRREIPIYEENEVDRDLVDEGQRNLETYFQSKGYFDVKVATQYDQQHDRVMISYQVDRGVRHRVGTVRFDGNRYFDDRKLQAAILVKTGRSLFGLPLSRGKFSDDLLRKSVVSLTSLYKNAGFSKVSVTPKLTDAEPLVDVAFEINEGDQDKVNSLSIEGNRTVSRATLSERAPLHLLPGQPYSAHLMELDRDQVLAAYQV